MKPSDVVISDPVPFTSTFGRAERDIAVAYLLLAMRRGSDTFRAVLPREVTEGESLYLWLENSFPVPDFDALLEEGWVERMEPDVGRGSPLAFTDLGIEKLRKSKWVRRHDFEVDELRPCRRCGAFGPAEEYAICPGKPSRRGRKVRL